MTEKTKKSLQQYLREHTFDVLDSPIDDESASTLQGAVTLLNMSEKSDKVQHVVAFKDHPQLRAGQYVSVQVLVEPRNNIMGEQFRQSMRIMGVYLTTIVFPNGQLLYLVHIPDGSDTMYYPSDVIGLDNQSVDI